MKVEKLIGTSPSSTFADLKNNVRNANFTHKITWTYADYTPTTGALTATVNAPLAYQPGTTNEKGWLKGWLVRDVVCYTKTAFAGIAYPEKFYNSLIEQGAILERKISYPDHHIFDENDMLNLAETANLTKSILVTTKKDFVRIPKSYRSLVTTLNGEIEFENENLLIEILSNLLENKINNISA